MNLSFFVKKWDIIKVIIGPIAISIPAVDDCINCSAQLIRKKGIKFPMIPIIINKNITWFVKIIFFFCILKKNNRKREAITNLNDATAVGEKVFKLTFIAKNADPHIADKIINKKKLLKGKYLYKN